MSHFGLCLQSEGIAALHDLCDVLDNTKADPFPVLYQPYTAIVEDDNIGLPIKAGLPLPTWHYDWLSQPDVDTLLGYDGQQVYVRTEKHTGQIKSFATFLAYCVITSIGEPILTDGGIPFLPQRRGPIDIEYRAAVEQ